MRETFVVFLTLSLLVSALHYPSGLGVQSASSGPIVVPDDYDSIQEAIEKASAGDRIVVKQGIYQENLVIKKPLTITGVGATIRSLGKGDSVKISAKGVEFKGFCVVGSGNQYSGIYVQCSGACLENNTVSDFLYGIQIYDSESIILRNNVMFRNHFNLKVWGLTVEQFLHDIDSSNLVNGRKVCYVVGLTRYVVPPDVGYVAVINSSCVTMENVTLSSNGEGILIAYSNSCEIRNAEVTNCQRGVRLIVSNNVTLSNSFVRENGWAGVVVDSSCDNRLSNNTFDGNGVGLIMSGSVLLGLTSKKNVVEENEFTGNYRGVYLSGVYDNAIVRNKIRLNDFGVDIESSEGNVLYDNAVEGNSLGFQIQLSRGNLFYHNSFIKNVVHVRVNGLISKNTWNRNYSTGGNFWDSPVGTDVFCGVDQTVEGSDGVMDESYKIADGNVDFYPFMFPIQCFDTGSWAGETFFVKAVTNASVTRLGFNLQGKLVSFSAYRADVDNGFCGLLVPKNLLWCDSVEDWLLLVDDIEHPCRIFENSYYTYFCFEFENGSHSVLILGERSIEESYKFGDVSNDGEPNLCDLLLVVQALGSFPGHPRWNVRADLDNDGRIDLNDVYLVMKAIFRLVVRRLLDLLSDS